MPRVTHPDLVERIRGMAADGHSQMEIARRLSIQQPRVSKIMIRHRIERNGRGSTSDAIVGTARYFLPNGALTIFVQINLDGKPFKTLYRGSPAQLQKLADYAAAFPIEKFSIDLKHQQPQHQPDPEEPGTPA